MYIAEVKLRNSDKSALNSLESKQVLMNGLTRSADCNAMITHTNVYVSEVQVTYKSAPDKKILPQSPNSARILASRKRNFSLLPNVRPR